MAYYINGDGEELRRLRLRKGLSQTELAAETGVHRNTISSAERGYPVLKKTAREIADVFIIEPHELAHRA